MAAIQPFRFQHLRAHLCNQKRLARVCEKTNSPGAFPRFAVCIRNTIDQLQPFPHITCGYGASSSLSHKCISQRPDFVYHCRLRKRNLRLF